MSILIVSLYLLFRSGSTNPSNRVERMSWFVDSLCCWQCWCIHAAIDGGVGVGVSLLISVLCRFLCFVGVGVGVDVGL